MRLCKFFSNILFVFFLSFQISLAQDFDAETDTESQSPSLSVENFNTLGAANTLLDGSLLYSNIDGQSYIGLRFQPVFRLGKFNIGVDIPVLRIFRYVSYGRKERDSFYIRAGDLTGAYIGYGLLLNNYTNSYSEEKRKYGVEWDIKLGDNFGIEGLYSHITEESMTMLALRPYVTPLSQSGIPILKTLEIGATYITDRDKTTKSTKPTLNNSSSSPISYNSLLSDNGITALAADMGITLLNTSLLTLMSSVQWAYMPKINDADVDALVSSFGVDYKAGNGLSVGVRSDFRLIANVFHLGAEIQWLNFSDFFLPQFFDGAYEMNKDGKISSLLTAKSKAGLYGSLTGHVINFLKIRGSLLFPDDRLNGAGMVNIVASTPQSAKIVLTARYYKGNADTFEDMFDIENSIASLRIGYQLNSFLVLAVDYYRTFGKNSAEGYSYVDQVMPRVAFRYQFED